MTSKRLQQIAIVMAVIAVIVSAIAVVVVERRNEPETVAAPPPADAMRVEPVTVDAAVEDPQPPEDPPDRGTCATTTCSGAGDCPAHACECDDGRVVQTRSCVNGCCSDKADACASSCDR